MDVYYIVKLLGPFWACTGYRGICGCKSDLIIVLAAWKETSQTSSWSQDRCKGVAEWHVVLLILILKDETCMEVRQEVACNSVSQTFFD